MKSMTGFGSSEASGDGVRVAVEIKSVNSRFCDINVRLPSPVREIELRLSEAIKKQVLRGHIDAFVSWECERESASPFNLDLARNYCSQLLELKEELGLKGDPELGLILQFPDIFKSNSCEPELEALIPLLDKAFGEALTELDSAKSAEGERIRSDFAVRIGSIEDRLEEIERLAPQQSERVKKRLEDNLKSLKLSDLDSNRISMEATIWADRLDVTEECIRLRSHCQQFMKLLSSEGAIGKSLGFLLQEMNREANTIGSKSADAEISQISVSIKEEVEKIREQVQNVE